MSEQDDHGSEQAVPAKSADDEQVPRLIVGIGASAGGLEAYETFLRNMPHDSGMAFVLVQHLFPKRPSMLADLLGRRTKMPVIEARDGLLVERDRVYVIPPNASLTIASGRLRVIVPLAPHDHQTVIDRFLLSLAEDQGTRAVCIIVSGAGREGTLGVKAVKEHGGLTMAQSAGSAAHPSMPQSAAEAGNVDLVLEVDRMPQALLGYADNLNRLIAPGDEQPFEAKAVSHLGRVYKIMRNLRDHDFSEYKENTILRRVQRRMQVLQIADIAAYVERLEADADEREQLFQDLLIGVTRFFRDPAAFEALAQEVIPAIIADHSPGERIRVWVPGCATGEEAYSIAMLLRERLSGRPNPVQIFATDISEAALATARTGLYPAAALVDMPPERVERFFVPEAGLFRIVKDLREMCMFAVQNLCADPPFSRLDLISCRNLLIYFGPELQARLMPLFHYALREDGFLFLGSAENIGRHNRLFSVVDRKARIFRWRIARSDGRPTFPASVFSRAFRNQPQPRLPAAPRPSPAEWAQGVVLDRHAPGYLVVDEHFEVLQFSQHLSRFLDPPAGGASLNVFNLVHQNLRLDLRAALQKASRSRATVSQEAIRVEREGEARLVDLVVEPRLAGDRTIGMFVVIFKDRPARVESGPIVPADAQSSAERLEYELRATRERLQMTIEQLETSNEELASSNEELLSMNEELQSSNEELEASQEELQSLNEELETVNAQLRDKVDELDQAKDDVINLLESTAIATLFLDADLIIKRFTPGLAEVIGLQPGDEGRRLSDFAFRFDYPNLLEATRAVIREGAAEQVEIVRGEDDRAFMLRIMPYRTSGQVIEGAVLTFVDISEIRAAEGQLRTQRQRAALAIAASGGGIYEHNVPLDEASYHGDRWAAILGYTRAELPTYSEFPAWLAERVHPEDSLALLAAYEGFVSGAGATYDVEARLRHKDGRWVWVRNVAQAIERDQAGRVTRLVGLMFDVTRERAAQEELRRTVSRLRMVLDGSGLGVWEWDLEQDQLSWDEQVCHLLGLDPAVTRPSPKRFFAAVHPRDRDRLRRAIDKAVASGERYSAEFRVVLPGGEVRRLGSHGQVQRDSAGRAARLIGVNFERADRWHHPPVLAPGDDQAPQPEPVLVRPDAAPLAG